MTENCPSTPCVSGECLVSLVGRFRGNCGRWRFERSEGHGHRHLGFFFSGKNWGDSRKVASLDAIAQWGGHEVGWRRGWKWGGVKAA